MLSPLFFSIQFLTLDFSLLLCGAVFDKAGAFNGDLSTWQVGEVTRMDYSTYTLFPPLQDRFFFWLFLSSLLSLLSALIYVFFLFNLLSSFFSTNFYHWTFLCWQCLWKLLPSMVISPPGRSGKWRP